METYRGYQIRKSGKMFWKATLDGHSNALNQRFLSVEAVKAAINATVEHRVYTPEEYRTVYPK
jgi:hypothetical protein